MTTNNENENSQSIARAKSFSIKLGEYLHKRFSEHLQRIKHLKKSTKRKWIEEAFLEKLESESELTPDKLEEKYLHFQVNHQLYEQIEQRVDTIKKFRNFSKKQWMMDAIYTKLEKEEHEAKNLMREMLNPLAPTKKS